MTKHPVALAIALALVTSSLLTGCDRTASLTEQEHIQRAKDFEEKGNFKGSILELKNAIQKNPDSSQARLLLGDLYIKSGQGESAEKELLRARELGIGDERILPLLGEAFIQQRSFQKVLDQIVVNPGFSSLNRSRIEGLRANALLGLGKIDAGCDLHTQAHATDAANLIAYHGLAACAWVRGERETSMHWLHQALDINPKDAATLRLLAQRSLDAGKLGDAAGFLDRAIASAPTSIAAHTQRGVLYLMQNQQALARKEAETIRRIVPRHPDADYLDAFALYTEKKNAEALNLIQQAVKKVGNLPAYLMLLGSIQLESGALEQAQQTFARVLSIQPNHTAARKFQALAKLKLGQPAESRKMLQPLLQASFLDSGTFMLAGKTESAVGNWQEAERYQRAALKQQPDNSTALLDLGQALAQQGKFDEALETIEQARKIAPPGYEADILLIRTRLRAGQFQEALQAAQALIKREPRADVAYLLAARAHLALKQTDAAIETLRQSVAQTQDSLAAHAMLSALYVQAKRFDQAEAVWRAELDRNPRRVEAMFVLADLAKYQGRADAARDWLDRAEKIAPGMPAVALRLAARHIAENAPGKAINVLRAALQAHPAQTALLGALGEAQLAASDPNNARSNFERALQTDAANPRWKLGLALAEFAQGNLRESRAHLDKLLADQPAYYPAYDNLVLVLMREGKTDEALKIALRAQSAFPNTPAPYQLEGDILLAARLWDRAAIPLAKVQALNPSGNTLLKLHKARSRNGALPAADNLLDDWLARQPNDITVRLARAELRLARLDLARAEQDYMTILKIDPKRIEALNNLAFILQDTQTERALGYARQAHAMAPDDLNVLDTYGWLLASKAKDYNRALPLLKRAVEGAPNLPAYRLHYASALFNAGDLTEARAQLKPLLALKDGALYREALKLHNRLNPTTR